jgi:hypothetical protein
VTVEEEDRLDDEDDPKKIASVAHYYIMMHFAEKESIKRNERRSTSLRQANTA